jgi:hypothetical protein
MQYGMKSTYSTYVRILKYRNNFTFLRTCLIYEYFPEYERQKFAETIYREIRA